MEPNKLNDLHEALREENSVVDDEETVWLLSYADLMTLLFTFFVMLYSSTLLDNNEKLRKSLAAYLNNEIGLFPSGSENGSGSESAANKEIQNHATADIGHGLERLEQNEQMNESLKQLLEKKLKEESILSDSQLLQTTEGLEITFSTQLLFPSGSDFLKDDSLDSLKKVIEILLNHGVVGKIRVEGHSDAIPIKSSRFRSNWELSGARAAAIVSFFEAHGFPSRELIAIGYGSSRPIVPNTNPDGSWNKIGLQKNRRVVITILQKTKTK